MYIYEKGISIKVYIHFWIHHIIYINIYFMKAFVVCHYPWHGQHRIKMATLNVIPEVTIHHFQSDELGLVGVMVSWSHVEYHSIGRGCIHLKRQYMATTGKSGRLRPFRTFFRKKINLGRKATCLYLYFKVQNYL